MARREVMRGAKTYLVASVLFGATAALAANPPNALDNPPSSITAPPPVDILQTAPAPLTAPAPRELSGNPLWAIPLSTLSATRERPLFTPSRRPPQAGIAGPPPTEPVAGPQLASEPERPRLLLVGAIVGDSGGIAIFVDQATNDVVRLRTGESHSGWMLRSVKGREAVFQKNSETINLAMPVPGAAPPGAPPAPGVPGAPATGLRDNSGEPQL